MNGQFSSGYNALRKQIGIISGITPVEYTDFSVLKESIETETSKYISLVALQRFFGHIPSKFAPSLYTLNVLSIYCKHKSWIDYYNNLAYR